MITIFNNKRYGLLKASIIFILIISILSTILLVGCSSEIFSIYFGINTVPKNIDPQKAQTYSELLTVRNCFRGLVTLSENNEVILDLAEKYTVNNSNTEYTFTLKDSNWDNGMPLTANDYAFAIKRAANPETLSPSFEYLSNLIGKDGAPQVKAIDDHTVSFILNTPDKNFLNNLYKSVFMPCNQEFFEKCGGRYGLNKNDILTNGKYKVVNWSDKQIKLLSTDDSKFNGPKVIYLTESSTGKDNIKRLKDNEIGMAAEGLHDFADIDKYGYTVETQYFKNYAIVFNKSDKLVQNSSMTEAFAQSVNRNYYTSKINSRFQNVTSVIPPDATLLSKEFKNFDKYQYKYNFQPEIAREKFLQAVSSLPKKKLPDISILCWDNSELKSILTDVISQWQSILGAYVNISTVHDIDALYRAVTKGDFTVAFVPFDKTTEKILAQFANEESGMYIGNKEYDKAIDLLSSTDDFNNASSAADKCLEILSHESSIIPIISIPTAFIYDEKYENVKFSIIDGTVDFSKIYLKN